MINQFFENFDALFIDSLILSLSTIDLAITSLTPFTQ